MATVIRLVLDGIDLLCRAVVWLLLRACWGLEAASAWLQVEQPHSVPAMPPIRYNPRLNDYPLRGSRNAKEELDPDFEKFMKVLGTKDRAEAEAIWAKRAQ